MAALQRGYSRPQVQGRGGFRHSSFTVLEVASPRQVSRGPNQGVSLAASFGRLQGEHSC